ncbi:MAG: UbiH/UbiF/VisC/COQ6 family ubiquinone biosynthesis hydroxylase [Hyphomonadaceae bacterium]|nr:UbiH/UbiF/VisC/COQ6 family ubiquinone biosynthesis hydroxylase [Hyphomonadaceae bacterium]MBC6413206.1 UbiH/UbiF/VisC/COQ6 family ubiquinone biosynthesis hydroxylase [Hyphomonadaceae bacterium]
MNMTCDILVVGAGLAGMAAALACAHKGASVTLLDNADPAACLEEEFDGRASTIAARPFQMLRRLGIDERLGDRAEPITDILVSDGELSTGVSPLTLHFDADTVGSKALGYMMENRHLRRALYEAVSDHPAVEYLAPVTVVDIKQTALSVSVELSDGRNLAASLVVAADGRESRVRQQAGISVMKTSYRQKAIVTTVAHEHPHNGVAHELFLPPGPFAILPLSQNRSSIVWTDSPRAVDAAMALPEAAFAAELARRFGNMYGTVEPCAPHRAYDLSLQLCETYVDNRIALIGDAAHVIHPIAGQGLNMGFRDAAALADIVTEARATGQDPGIRIEQYGVRRKFDNFVMAASTDILNRMFSTDFAPLKYGRRLGLGLVEQIRPARQFFMREAAGQTGDLPSLFEA